MLKDIGRSQFKSQVLDPKNTKSVESFKVPYKPKKAAPRSISQLRTHFLAESLNDEDHIINKVIRGEASTRETFLPYMNERDSLNRLIKVE